MQVSEGDKNAVAKHLKFVKNQITNMVEVVRGKLEPLQRSLIGVLIVLDVHGRDVVDQLVKCKIESTFDFE